MILRPYQERGVAEIRAAFNGGARRVLFALSTKPPPLAKRFGAFRACTR